MKRALTSNNSAGRVEWPTLLPGWRWKVKRTFKGVGYDVKVCLQFKLFGLIWWTYKSQPVKYVDGKDIFVATGVVARDVLRSANTELKALKDRSKISGVHKQDSY